MIITGLIKTATPNVPSPAIIKDGVLYCYDFGNKVMRVTKDFKESFITFRFLDEGQALAWWHKNMDIAHKWSTGESKDASPEFDKELLKAFPVKTIPEK
jgi:hypothetical protein